MLFAATYYFDGIPRRQFLLENPNHLGVLLAIAVCVLTGLTANFAADSKNSRRGLKLIVGACSTVYLQYLLIGTYSRSAWVAVTIGMFVFFLTGRRRVVAGLLIVCFLAQIAFSPAALRRAHSVASIGTDPSISNRLDIWRATTHIISENPIWGVGRSKFQSEYSAWYQPIAAGGRPTGAINSYLTVCVYFGSPALCFLMFSFLSVGALSILFLRIRSDPVTAALFSAFCSCSVGFLFSDVIFNATIVVAVGVIVVVMVARIGTALPISRRRLIQLASVCGAVSLYVSLGIIAFGKNIGNDFIAHREIVIQPGKARMYECHYENNDTDTTIFYISGVSMEIDYLAKYILRPVAASGLTVITFIPSNYGFAGQRETEDAIRALATTRRIDLIGGDGDGARLAIVAAIRSNIRAKRLIAINPQATYPFGENSLDIHLKGLACPLDVIVDPSLPRGFSQADGTAVYKAASQVVEGSRIFFLAAHHEATSFEAIHFLARYRHSSSTTR